MSCIVLCIPFTGCFEDVLEEETVAGQASIGSSGGSVVGPRGAELVVPAGAVAQEMTVVIEEALEDYPDPMNLEIESPVFAFMPHGMTFSEAVKIRLPLPNGNADDFAMVTSETGGGWIHVHPAKNADGFLEVDVTHFSFFAVTSKSSIDVVFDGERTEPQYCGGLDQPCCPRSPDCAQELACVPTVCTKDCILDTCFEPSCESECRAKLPNGLSCHSDDECTSGLCVDTICCESSCEGQCEACNVSGFVGSCVPVTGAPRGDRPSCSNDFDPLENQCGLLCDGIDPDLCSPQPAGSICGSSCSDGIRPTTGMLSTCDGSGSCVGAYPFSCTPFVCDGNSGTCASSCEDDADCADGAVCADSPRRCILFTPHGYCNPNASEYWYWSAPDVRTAFSCLPYACNDEYGGCMHRCDSTLDCYSELNVLFYQCDAYSKCIPY